MAFEGAFACDLNLDLFVGVDEEILFELLDRYLVTERTTFLESQFIPKGILINDKLN